MLYVVEMMFPWFSIGSNAERSRNRLKRKPTTMLQVALGKIHPPCIYLSVVSTFDAARHTQNSYLVQYLCHHFRAMIDISNPTTPQTNQQTPPSSHPATISCTTYPSHNPPSRPLAKHFALALVAPHHTKSSLVARINKKLVLLRIPRLVGGAGRKV
jgi:hypothetical protein